MTIALRLEKLRFIVDDLQIALHLANHAPDAGIARMLARHILIRAFDFIDHARGLRKPLAQAGFDVAEFHRTKEAYAAAFDEYFVRVRHRLGAHVQDLDFEERLALWNDIEVVKADYFVDGAREIYVHLGTLNPPGYAPFVRPPELDDAALASRLEALRLEARREARPEMASDSLALTRSNTVTALNTTPVHQRAAQLALLRRWVKDQKRYLEHLAEHPRVRRILRARLITDIVSFADCLTTRPVAPDAPQAMAGLDDLIREGGQSAAPLEALRRVIDVESVLTEPRTVRNKIGGHLDIDPATAVPALVARLDQFDLESSLRLFDRFEAAFIKACRGVIYLVGYIADGHRMRGVLGVTGPTATPFNPSRPDARIELAPPVFDLATYQAQLMQWRGGDPEAQADAKAYFYDAFNHAPETTCINREESLGLGARYHQIHLRTSHQFIADALAAASDDQTVGEIVELVSSAARGSPLALTEILLGYAQRKHAYHKAALIHGLGQTAPWWHEEARTFLWSMVASTDATFSLWARGALMLMLIRDEGLVRANRQGAPRGWPDILSELSGGAPGYRLPILLILVSQFWAPGARTFARWFEPEMEDLQQRTRQAIADISDPEVLSARAGVVDHLVKSIDTAGLALMLATELATADQTGVVDACLWAVCFGPAICAAQDDALRHLALCFLRKDQLDEASEIAADLAGRNPDRVEYQLLKIDLAGRRPGAGGEALAELELLRAHYVLTGESLAAADRLERELRGDSDNQADASASMESPTS